MSLRPETPHDVADEVRLFDAVNATITGRVLAENSRGVIIERPVKVIRYFDDENEVLKLRLEPIALVGDRYLLYWSGLRGESYVINKALREMYEALTAPKPPEGEREETAHKQE